MGITSNRVGVVEPPRARFLSVRSVGLSVCPVVSNVAAIAVASDVAVDNTQRRSLPSRNTCVLSVFLVGFMTGPTSVSVFLIDILVALIFVSVFFVHIPVAFISMSVILVGMLTGLISLSVFIRVRVLM